MKFYETKEYIFLKTEEPNEFGHSILRIDREQGHTEYADEVPAGAKGSEYVAVLGLLRLLKGPYFVLVTGSAKVGVISGHEVWRVSSTELFPLQPWQSTTREADERQYLAMLRSVLARESFYYSPTLDLTNTLQRRWEQQRDRGVQARSRLERLDPRFFWNKYLLKDFNDPGLEHWLTPVMLGFIGIEEVPLPGGKRATLAVISRRNSRRAGTRYTVRGADRDGNVANNVETEQLLISDVGETSLVQTRGSIPLVWEQTTNVTYKPKPLLTGEAQAAFQRHFNEQIDLYGAQVLVNLIDQKGSEKVLGEAFASTVGAHAGHLRTSLRYVAFDFHRECKKMHYENIDKLLAEIGGNLLEHGFFSLQGGERQSAQLGVVRTNCMDSLDRTNAVQSRIAHVSIPWQLACHGVDVQACLQPPGQFERGADVPFDAAFEAAFRRIWADNGDTIARQYAGTGALKSDYTRTGRRTIAGVLGDGLASVTRYWLNNFHDGWRQDAYDLFLGNHVADAGSPSPFKRSIALPWAAVVVFFFTLVGGSTFALSQFILPADARPTYFRAGTALIVLGSLLITRKVAFLFGSRLVDRPQFGIHK